MRIQRDSELGKDSLPVRIFDISEFSKDNGPGRRAVVYFQGCNIHCKWCHSPHSQPRTSPLLFNQNNCVKCKRCVAACSRKVHRFEGNKHIVNRALCNQCGKCIEHCPLSIEGVNGSTLYLPTVTISVSGLFNQIEPYLRLDPNGGITLSGGEALLQLDAAKELLMNCIDHGYHTAVETSGLLPLSIYAFIQPYVKLWIFGMRITTGDNTSYYSHINEVLQYLVKKEANILPRIPMVPGVFDKDEILVQLKELLNRYSIDTVQLLPWNKDFKLYYEKGNLPLSMDTPTPNEIESCEVKITSFFKQNNIRLYENRT